MMRRSVILALFMSVAASQVQAQSQVQTQVQADAPSQTAGKMVCRTREVTGSLVKKRRVCQLQGTWEKQSDSYKEQWEALQGTRGNTRGN
jgi:hypothetical protein